MVSGRVPLVNMDRFVDFPGRDPLNVETAHLAGPVCPGLSLLDSHRGPDCSTGSDRYFIFPSDYEPLSPASLFIVMRRSHSFHRGRGIDYLG